MLQQGGSSWQLMMQACENVASFVDHTFSLNIADKTTWKLEFWCGQKRSVITTTKSWLEFGCLCEQHSGPLV
jgi:hypothetical protein